MLPAHMDTSGLSPAQRTALKMALAGPLKRFELGWATDSSPRGGKAAPRKPVSTGTIRALERRGLLRRCLVHAADWQDSRELTPAALAALEGRGHLKRVSVLLCESKTCRGDENGCARTKCGPGRKWRIWTHPHFVYLFGRCPYGCVGSPIVPSTTRIGIEPQQESSE